MSCTHRRRHPQRTQLNILDAAGAQTGSACSLAQPPLLGGARRLWEACLSGCLERKPVGALHRAAIVPGSAAPEHPRERILLGLVVPAHVGYVGAVAREAAEPGGSQHVLQAWLVGEAVVQLVVVEQEGGQRVRGALDHGRAAQCGLVEGMDADGAQQLAQPTSRRALQLLVVQLKLYAATLCGRELLDAASHQHPPPGRLERLCAQQRGLHVQEGDRRVLRPWALLLDGALLGVVALELAAVAVGPQLGDGVLDRVVALESDDGKACAAPPLFGQPVGKAGLVAVEHGDALTACRAAAPRTLRRAERVLGA
mmetsp:Transcript_36860/g.101695  ORF Transcript_36860/g.101695 Transcript_36860/m.101695 type:complete len:312 (+) Transcript_36860:317-1252(+)|eukprot:149363-Prymnesium_polylepis.1